MGSIGVPIKLLHEAEKHVITVELKTGEIYRGQLIEAEDNMNVQLKTITMITKDGKQVKLEYAFIRGSKVRWFIIPDMLKNAPMFRRADQKNKGLGLGMPRGKGPAGRGRIQRPPAKRN